MTYDGKQDFKNPEMVSLDVPHTQQHFGMIIAGFINADFSARKIGLSAESIHHMLNARSTSTQFLKHREKTYPLVWKRITRHKTAVNC